MEFSHGDAEIPLDEDEQRQLLLSLIAQLRCVECGQLYDPEDIAVLHRGPDLWVLNARCHHCDAFCHVLVFLQLELEPEPIMDLTPEERDVADAWPAITPDDILDIHLLLESFEGDLQLLLPD